MTSPAITREINQDTIEQCKVALACIVPPAAVLLHRGFWDWRTWVAALMFLLHIPAAVVSAMTVQAYAHLPSLLFAFWVICTTPAA